MGDYWVLVVLLLIAEMIVWAMCTVTTRLLSGVINQASDILTPGSHHELETIKPTIKEIHDNLDKVVKTRNNFENGARLIVSMVVLTLFLGVLSIDAYPIPLFTGGAIAIYMAYARLQIVKMGMWLGGLVATVNREIAIRTQQMIIQATGGNLNLDNQMHPITNLAVEMNEKSDSDTLNTDE